MLQMVKMTFLGGLDDVASYTQTVQLTAAQPLIATDMAMQHWQYSRGNCSCDICQTTSYQVYVPIYTHDYDLESPASFVTIVPTRVFLACQWDNLANACSWRLVAM